MAAQTTQLDFLLAALLLVRSALGDEEVAKVCSAGTLVASVSPIAPSVSFQCAETQQDQGQTRAPAMQFSAYTGDSCNKKQTQATVDSVLRPLNAGGSWSGTKLTLSKFPAQNEKICLLCKNAEAVTCTVVVDIAKDAATCSRSGEKAVDLDLTLAENETVYFRCPDQDKLSPQTATKAYKEDCRREPEPLLEGMVRNGNDKTMAYTLSLEKPPATTKTFCYKCGASSEKREAAPHCYIKVTTQATTPATTDPSHTSTTTSGTAISEASVASACSIAVASLAIWR